MPRLVGWVPRACVLLVLTGCASARLTVYSPERLSAGTRWTVGFVYEQEATAASENSSGQKQNTTVRLTQSAANLQLRDNIFFALKDKHSIDVAPTETETTQRILILPNEFALGGFSTLDVRFEDRSQEVLARIKIKNSDRNCCYLDRERFAEFAAQKIAEAIKTGK